MAEIQENNWIRSIAGLLSIHGACLRAQSCSKKKYHGRELSELLGLDDFDDFAYDT